MTTAHIRTRRFAGAALAAVLVAPGAASAQVALEGRFGRAEVNTTRPAVTSLALRRPDGALEPHSVVSPIGGNWERGVAGWAEGAGTYVMDQDGRSYGSRAYAPDRVTSSPGLLVLDGVKLAAGPGEPAVARERWEMRVRNGALEWTVQRRWLRGMATRMEGTPALYSSFRRATATEQLANSVTHTLWVDPGDLASHFEPLYRAWPADYKMSVDNATVVTRPDTWAVAKLWTNWDSQSDLRLAVRGGHLFRRGFFGWRAELGAVRQAAASVPHRVGDTETVTLVLDTIPRNATGYQLPVQIPDPRVQETLSSFYSRLLNGGVVNDQKHFNFGNETDGWYYDGSTWMQGLAISAGVPAPGATASNPYDVATAFRNHLASIVGTVDAKGRGNFGYDWAGNFPDARLNNVIGAREYLVHTGDLAFVRQILPDLERGVGWFLTRRGPHGLADLGEVAHWYYDAMPSSGINANHNALLYRACLCLAEMEAAAGDRSRAAKLRQVAAEVKAGFNRMLWNESAPGGPRLTDWIAHDGEKVTYAADVCQFPAVAFGMLPRDRTRALLATLDRRIADLGRDFGYTGSASFSAYWPVPNHINTLTWQQGYPIYMNGGSFLAITYYEIMARIEAGDVEGAWKRTQLFSQGIARHGGAGNNWVTATGDVAAGADEPYLSDMVVVPSVLVHGFMGIHPTWDRLEVHPHLPAGWKGASTEILYKGVLHRVVIRGDKVTIQRLGRRHTPPSLLEWEVRPAVAPQWQMTISRHFANGAAPPRVSAGIDLDSGQRVRLATARPARGLLGRWGPAASDGLVMNGTLQEDYPRPPVGTQFAGGGYFTVPDPSWFRFSPTESFTLQCRIKTTAQGSCVMVSRPEAYCLYVKSGRLAAWIMQADLQHREALGSHVVADGEWHQVAAVYDRAAQRLSLYVDGKLDTPTGQPAAANPVDIAPIGLSSSAAPVSIGGLGPSFLYAGLLDDVRINAGAVAPADLGATGEAAVERRLARTGSYTTSVCDWGQQAAAQALVIQSKLNGGIVAAALECSKDRFRTVGRRVAVPVRDGLVRTPLSCGRWRYLRLRLDLAASKDGTRTPVVSLVRLVAR